MDLKAISETFGVIQSALGEEKKQTPTISVPVSALLSVLPEEFRGKAWKAGACPPGELKLDRNAVLSQLKKGKVAFPLIDFLADLPEGWVAPGFPSSTMVSFDLPQVFAAMPASLLQMKSDDKGLAAVIGGPALFKPKTTTTATPASAVSAPATPTQPPPAVAKAAPPPAQEAAPAVAKPTPAVPATPVSIPPPPVAAKPVQPPAPATAPALFAAKPAPVVAPAAPVAAKPAPAAPAPAVQTAAEEKGQPGMSTVTARFGAIQSILGSEQEDNVSPIPCSALLSRLPENLRGSAWKSGGFPAATLLLDTADLLLQLKTGRVHYPLSRLRQQLPAGWVAEGVNAEVDLDLAQVVCALPPEAIQGAKQKSKAYMEIEKMQDVFSTRRPPPAAEAAKTEPAPVAAKPAAPEPAKPEAKPAEIKPVETKHEPAIEAVKPAVEAAKPQPVVEAVKPVAEPAKPEAKPAEIKPVETKHEPAIEVAKPAVEAAKPQPVVEAVKPVAEPAKPEAKPVEAKHEPVIETVKPAVEAVKPETVVEAVIPVAEAAVPETEEEIPAAAKPTERVYEPKGWSGIEDAFTATNGVDINTASGMELAKIPGVGSSRALEIVGFREENGPFKHIFEISRIPSIGSSLFKQMTGLSLTTGANRHLALAKLLRVEAGQHLSMAAMLEAAAARIGAGGCVMSSDDGVTLARTASLAGAEELTDNYAAVNAQLFRRTGKYLRNLTGTEVDCILLPAATPALLLFATDDFYFVFTEGEKKFNARGIKAGHNIVCELNWLFGRRAIVRNV